MTETLARLLQPCHSMPLPINRIACLLIDAAIGEALADLDDRGSDEQTDGNQLACTIDMDREL